MTDDREPFREARAAGLQKRHEQRLENATYTAAEVKVLTEEACKVTYALGRKQALEEAAKKADWFAVGAVFPDEAYTRAFRQGCTALAHRIREMAQGDPTT